MAGVAENTEKERVGEMKILKKRYFAGAVCEQIVWRASDRITVFEKAQPKPRFKDEEERIRHRQEQGRKRHARSFNANFGPDSLYITLTFSNEFEVHSFEEARVIRETFSRRLLYKYPNAVFRIYMGRGKGTNRIHFHMACKGVPEDYIKRQWKFGKVTHVRALRAHNYYDGVDHGQDYTGLANYLYDHWTEEQGGRHYRRTKNEVKPAEEPTVQSHRNYSVEHPPIAPKGYTLVSAEDTPYGCMYFKYVAFPENEKTKKKHTARRRCG